MIVYYDKMIDHYVMMIVRYVMMIIHDATILIVVHYINMMIVNDLSMMIVHYVKTVFHYVFTLTKQIKSKSIYHTPLFNNCEMNCWSFTKANIINSSISYN